MGTHRYSRDTARVLECKAAAANRRPRVAVLSCAGAYVSGAAGSNECPAGSVRIETEAACRTAAAAAGKTVDLVFVETHTNYPRGCYYALVHNNVFLNTNAVGGGAMDAQLLCTTGAPLTRRCADARCACAGAHSCTRRRV